MADAIPLRDAVAQFAQMRGAWNASYDWWRRLAQRGQRLSFGRTRQLVRSTSTAVSVFKTGGRWYVDADEFTSAMTEHDAYLAEMEHITQSYENRRLLVGAGQALSTRWGSYRVFKDFHVRVSDRRGTGERASETWVCNSCWAPAESERDREECHVCRDWGTCGRDCTLTAVHCNHCSTRFGL